MEVIDLSFSFENQEPLFQNLTLHIHPEKLTVFLGPSGCGKSTLLRILAGLQKVGTHSLFGENEKASFVFQEPTLLPWLDSYRNIMLPIELACENKDADDFQEIVKLLKISDCLQKLPSALSGGQKMRVSIARALITRPQILFMDEPFSALDEPTRLILQDELKLIQKKLKMTILFVTHSFYEAAYLGDRVLIFSQGRPTCFIYDQLCPADFSSRFDLTYQKKVQDISSFFLSEGKNK